jgi:2,4-dichlorophenol 6-monooxygenase
MTAQIAERYRAGRVFLAGDAAHRFPPSGGLGMNTGIQDVHNLAWKLRLVCEGAAGDALLDTYETERRPVARENADHSMQNALRMIEVFEALGVPFDLNADRAAAHAQMTDTLAAPGGRERVRAAIENQRGHFDTIGLQLGIAYEDGALVPDGTPPATVANRASDHRPSTRPGSRLPHAWVLRDGVRVSTLDLVAEDRFTLLTGPAVSVADMGNAVRVLVDGRDFVDADGRWATLSGIGDDGALLVRPDQHVAWRASAARTGMEGEVLRAMARILDRPPAQRVA